LYCLTRAFLGSTRTCVSNGIVKNSGVQRAGRRIKIKNDELYISFSETFGCATPN